MKSVLVFDLGASSGRAMLCSLENGSIAMKEVHRFSNDPVMVNKTLYWDILRLFHEIKQGIVKANGEGGFESIGIDTWGVDFGMIGSDRLLENPVCYRDRRTSGILPRAFEKISPEELYDITGVEIMEINTAFQLLYLKLCRENILSGAQKILLTPDLLNFMLTGEMRAEMSIASTTGLMDAGTKKWSERVIHALGLPENIFPDIIPPGTEVGTLSEDICGELCVPPCAVTAVCGHDTQCACAAVPAHEKDFIFVSCGTWSLFGTETDAPVISGLSRKFNITNETGFGGKTTFMKNIIGLWFIQETRRFLSRQGEEYSFAQLESLARSAEPMKCFIDPSAPEFVPPGNIPERVRAFCRRTGQYVPESLGEVLRCIYESLAMKYRQSLSEISLCTGKKYEKIYMVGGGIKDSFLCSLAACACGCPVSAGPVEATAYGNAAIQLISGGAVSDISEAREIISRSEDIKMYYPENTEDWDRAYERYEGILGK